MFDYILESSHQDDSKMWSNIGFGQEIGILEIKIRILSGALLYLIETHIYVSENWDYCKQEKRSICSYSVFHDVYNTV